MRRTSLVAMILSLFGTLSLACGDTNDMGDGGGDASQGGDGHGDAGQGDAKADGGAGDGGGGDTTLPAKYMYLVIYDKEAITCSTTNGPGADIDAVEKLDSANAVVGSGKTGSTVFTPGSDLGATPCTDSQCAGGACKYAKADFKSRAEGRRDAIVMAVGDDVGYISLNTGALALQISSAADGTGAAVEIKSGDHFKIWEVDQVYKDGTRAPTSCKCVPERYNVFALTELSVAAAATGKLLAPGTFDSANTSMCSAAMTGDGCGSTLFTMP